MMNVSDAWTVGQIVIIRVAATYQVSVSGLYNVIAGPVVDELKPVVGMPVTLGYNGSDYNLFVASYTAAAGGADPKITLAYDSATGTAFSGLPNGAVNMSLVYGAGEFKVTALDGQTATVARLTTAGAVDTTWTGWVNRTSLDYQATGLVDSGAWLGPFLACPAGETTSRIEIDISMPNGIGKYNSKGKLKDLTITIELQYRASNGGTGWTSVYYSYTGAQIDARGYTHGIDLPAAMVPEVRLRRVTAMLGGNTREGVYWLGLRSRLSARPTSYPGVTTMAMTIVTGTKLAAQSDRRISVVGTRQYQAGTPRTISAAFAHVLRTVGVSDEEIDHDTLDYLEQTYWTPRGEFFDYAAQDDGLSVRDMLDKVTAAGMGYFLASDELFSAGREGIKAWVGSVAPTDTTTPLQTSFKAPSDDDFDAVDVTYINPVTWSEEVVECRLDDQTPRKIETFRVDGVLNRDVAYRIGMRRVMKHQNQRLSYSADTLLDSLNYNFGDHIVLADDIPGSLTTSSLIRRATLQGELLTLTVDEPLDWTIPSPRCLIRFQDGRLSGLLAPGQVDQHTLTVSAAGLHFEDWVMEDPSIEPPKLIFCSSTQVGYSGTVSDISPNSDGTAALTAAEYSPDFYQFDDASAP